MECEIGTARWRRMALAVVFGVALAACSEKPPPSAPAKIENAAEAAAAKAKQEAAEAERKQAEAQKQAAQAKAAADQVLAAKVKEAILAKPGLKSMAMDVRAADGEVTLYGTAASEAQRTQAQKTAAGVEGVKSVKNELKIVRGS